jgi:hypothetical protein
VDDDDGFDTPEACALAGWTPEWQARVIEVERVSADMAYVLVDTEPSHPMMVTCSRYSGRWREVGSGSANLPSERTPDQLRMMERLGFRRRRSG